MDDNLRKQLERISYDLAKKMFESKPETIKPLDTAVKGLLENLGLIYNLKTFKNLRAGIDLYLHFADDKAKTPEAVIEGGFRNSMMMRMYLDYLIGREEEKVGEALKDLK